MIGHPPFQLRAVGRLRAAGSTSRSSPTASRSSPWRTGTSACEGTSRRASRTAFPEPTSTASTRPGRCPIPRAATDIRRPGRQWSTSPTARSSGCSSTTSHSTSATASCESTSGRLTSARESCAAMPNGSRRRDRGSASRRSGWCHSSTGQWRRSFTRSSRSRRQPGSSCNRSWSRTSRYPGPSRRTRGRAPASALRSSRSSSTIARSGSCWPIAPPRAGC